MGDVKAVAQQFNIDVAVKRNEDGSPELVFEEEKLVKTFSPVAFMLSETYNAGVGTLYITNRRVVWLNQEQPLGFAITYPQIVMHAISRNAESFPKPCIYLQLDEGSEDMIDEEEAEDTDIPSAEAQLVPDDPSLVEEMFKALCECAAENPDPEMEADGEGEFFYDEDEVLKGLDEETRAALLAARYETAMELEEQNGGENLQEDLDELIGDDPGRFEDGDDDDDGEEENGDEEEAES